MSHAFRHGYVAADHAIELRDLPGWRSGRVGRFTVHRHPVTRWVTAANGSAEVAILGDAVDIDAGTADSAEIAQSVLSALTSGVDRAVRYVAYLGGRATVLLYRDGELVVVPDYAATQPVFWHHDASGTVFSSHAHLAGEVVGAPVNEPYRALMRQANEMKTKGTIYWPGIETPFIGVLPVLPNHVLRVRAGQTPRHERFYPFPDTTLERDPDRAFKVFSEVFSEHVRLLCTLSRHIGLSLTGGRDSRTTLAAAWPHLSPAFARTWTYLNVPAPTKVMADDAEAAARVAREYGLSHHLIDLHDKAPEDFAPMPAFEKDYFRTMRYTPQFRRLAVAYAEQLPPATIQLKSMVAEAGTGFYKKRSGVPDVGRLTYLYSPTPFGELPLVHSAFERFSAYSGLSVDAAGELDWHDLYYIECRMIKWGSLRMQECDLSHRTLMPFNSRGVIEALLGPDLEHRGDKQALTRFIAERGREQNRA
ncbi:hypothetical protein Psi02_23730 [Planotetraspora silvatica]|uniref:Asparagine synthetase domain-containing protein n=1 Tax=Planotetraspora silvatica TaxID=234614 RepID=A0A8J3XLU7_9ACTN|nr:hypothetical protein [Planotetraspora silvatica]GII45949.1 hypothetical protein Psi02_23730 [Planotetraspora silvatica]